MSISASDLLGLPGLPVSKPGVQKWLKAQEVPLAIQGKRFTFFFSDLPPEVHRAILEREIKASGLPVGTYDDDAHVEMMDATPAMGATAEAKAAIARDFLAIGSRLSWSRKIAFVRERHVRGVFSAHFKGR